MSIVFRVCELTYQAEASLLSTAFLPGHCKIPATCGRLQAFSAGILSIHSFLSKNIIT